MKLSNLITKRSNWVIPYVLFLILFTVLPLLLIGVYAFKSNDGGFTLQNFVKFATQSEALNTFIYSIGIALITTVLCILIGYPAAYILSNAELNRNKTLVMLFILPMWINVLMRSLATVALFDFMHLELGEGALIFGLVYDFLPFMIYPIYNTIQKIDKSYIEAAQDLGANKLQIFTKVIWPLSIPGIVSGILMVFLPTISTFAISEILTLNNKRLFGSIIQDNIMMSDTMNYGAALSLIMLIIIALTSVISNKEDDNINEGGLI
ncbi:MAG: ABC transporter permease [Bacteroidaceae bacterium]|jgi:spermidine/putrescine transport system permease protein|nr:ABC transporter permease [Bacteroidaceae bacterium]MBO5951658.1 ABC transporter permease [Bacteroidaceae bacterium]MBQ5573186.1 ABC transporter permease [Bacteroidaceae bacterium]MBR4303583.1 ABC transporter permease [Bacteroidaceae bacterium]